MILLPTSEYLQLLTFKLNTLNRLCLENPNDAGLECEYYRELENYRQHKITQSNDESLQHELASVLINPIMN